MNNAPLADYAARAYQTLWREKQWVFRLAVFPVLVKLACFLFALRAGLDDSFLTLTLCLVPGYLAEGWLLAHLIRRIGNAAPVRRDVLAGALAYTLINLLIGGFLAALIHFGPHSEDPAQVSALSGMIGIGGLVFAVWAFRLVWLHIPVSLGVPLARFFPVLMERGMTLKMLGVWALCFIPPVVAMLLVNGLILSPFGADDIVPPSAQYAAIVVKVLFDTLKSLLCTAALTGFLLAMMTGKGIR